MTGKKIGYIRTSTVDQNSARQLDGISLDKVFEDKVSGSTKDRPALNQLLDFIREGDEVVIHDISRCSRNMKHLIELVEEITSKGVVLSFVKEGLRFTGDKSNPMEELMLNLLGSVYQFERQMMLERQREGISKAKLRGAYTGRKKTVDEDEIMTLLNQGISMRKVAEMTGTSLSTVTRTKNKNK